MTGATLAACLLLAQPAAPADELGALLRQAGEYVVEYETSFSALVAEETYDQWVGDPRWSRRHRSTRAELVFVRLAGEFPWASFRDVFELDGRPVREPDGRLVTLLAQGGANAAERARELLSASATYNIGPVRRTFNLPTLPLLFLHPRNQPRFAFTLGPSQTIRGTDAVQILFQEKARPTLVRGPEDSDLPASGSFWLQAGRGAVLHSETKLRVADSGEATLTTEYRAEPALAMWVPQEMREWYGNLPRAKKGAFATPLECRARYRKFRRFSVSTQETVAVPEAPPPEPAGPPAPAPEPPPRLQTPSPR